MKLRRSRRTKHVAWGIAAVLLGATGLLFLRPYWIASYRGVGADLRSAFLPLAPLHSACLSRAHLQHADLRGADLDLSMLYAADLTGADLSRANLEHAFLLGANLQRANLRNARLREALYDAQTRWPAGFDPVKHGAIVAK